MNMEGWKTRPITTDGDNRCVATGECAVREIDFLTGAGGDCMVVLTEVAAKKGVIFRYQFCRTPASRGRVANYEERSI